MTRDSITTYKYEDISENLRLLAAAEGLHYFGLTYLREEPDFPRFHRWLDDGRQAGMGYLAANLALRRDPRLLLPGAKSALILGLPYYLGDKAPMRAAAPALPPRIAQYARLSDYHKVFWRRGAVFLERVLAAYGKTMQGGDASGDDSAVAGSKAAGRVITDSAPILERALAVRTGAGFIGKNTCFIDPQRGSFFLLGEVLTTLAFPEPNHGAEELPAVTPPGRSAKGGCGSCQRCQVHCPTGALAEDYSLDARLCLAYWTIEHRGTIPEQFWPWLRYYYFGCDICQLVCPYNRQASAPAATDLVRVKIPPDLFAVATMTTQEYEAMFAGTPMTRAKRSGLVRNALIALCVTHDPRLAAAMTLAQARAAGATVVGETIAQIRQYAAPAK